MQNIKRPNDHAKPFNSQMKSKRTVYKLNCMELFKQVKALKHDNQSQVKRIEHMSYSKTDHLK